MPRTVDHDERRRDLTEAVWRLVGRDGVRGASVRCVAREAGLSMGSVRHFFASQDELLRFAMSAVIDRATSRIRAGAEARAAAVDQGDGLEAASALLEEVLPLDEERLTEARVWAAFVAQAATDPALAEIRHQADDGIRELCRGSLVGLAELGQLAPERDLDAETERLWALVDGLTMHILLEPDRLTARRVRAVLRTHLADLAATPSTDGL